MNSRWDPEGMVGDMMGHALKESGLRVQDQFYILISCIQSQDLVPEDLGALDSDCCYLTLGFFVIKLISLMT